MLQFAGHGSKGAAVGGRSPTRPAPAAAAAAVRRQRCMQRNTKQQGKAQAVPRASNQVTSDGVSITINQAAQHGPPSVLIEGLLVGPQHCARRGVGPRLQQQDGRQAAASSGRHAAGLPSQLAHTHARHGPSHPRRLRSHCILAPCAAPANQPPVNPQPWQPTPTWNSGPPAVVSAARGCAPSSPVLHVPRGASE